MSPENSKRLTKRSQQEADKGFATKDLRCVNSSEPRIIHAFQHPGHVRKNYPGMAYLCCLRLTEISWRRKSLEKAWWGFNNCLGNGSSSDPSITNSISAKELSMAAFALRMFRTCAASCERSTPERMVATRSSAVSGLPAQNIAMMPPRSCLCFSRLFCVSKRSWIFLWLAAFLR